MQDLLAPTHVLIGLDCTSRKQLFEEIADCLAPDTELSSHAIVNTLWEREQLGTTGMGNGVAIPHGRISGISRVYGCAALLDQPLDFSAPDGTPVDLVFALLAPADAGADHLRALAEVSRILRNPDFCADCRQARDKDALYRLLINEATATAA